MRDVRSPALLAEAHTAFFLAEERHPDLVEAAERGWEASDRLMKIAEQTEVTRADVERVCG